MDGGTVRLPRIVGLGRALALSLRGRPVAATEALQMGLVNRVVPAGQVRAVAEQLARDISAFPQACLRSDRLAALEGSTLDQPAALANEFRRGGATIEETGPSGVRRLPAAPDPRATFRL